MVSWKSWMKDHGIKYHQIKDHRIKELIQSHYDLILHILLYIMLHIHHVAYVSQNCPIILNFIQGLLSAIVIFNSTTPNQNETNEKICVGHSFYCIWWLPKEPSTFSSPDSLFSVEGDRGAGEGGKRENRGREARAEINKAIVCCILLGFTQSKTHLHLYFSVW